MYTIGGVTLEAQGYDKLSAVHVREHICCLVITAPKCFMSAVTNTNDGLEADWD